MLHILILILKILGIILLAILGIAILLLGVVLFVPVSYCFEAETPSGLGNLTLRGRASWLFRTAYAYLDYRDRKWDWQVRVLWKKFRVDDKHEHSDIPDELPKTIDVDEVDTREVEHAEPETSPADTPRKKSKKKRKTKKPNLIEKIRYTIRDICDKIKQIIEKKNRIIEYISDEVHQAAFGRVTKETIALIRRLRPKKVKGEVRFGFKEPYDTGRVLAVLSVLYPFYGENIKIDPEFEEEVLEGSVVIKGRAHLFPFVVTICRLFLDENVKTAYKNFRRK